MKKIMILFGIVILLFVVCSVSAWTDNNFYINNSGTIINSSCYQESFNVSNQTGQDGDCGLDYSGNMSRESLNELLNDKLLIDGNWSSYTRYANPAANYAIIYKKPANSYAAIWNIKDASGNNSLIIPSDCFNNSFNYIYLYVSSSTGNDGWYCYNNTDFKLLYTYANASIYEEAVTWNISTNSAINNPNVGSNYSDKMDFSNSGLSVYTRYLAIPNNSNVVIGSIDFVDSNYSNGKTLHMYINGYPDLFTYTGNLSIPFTFNMDYTANSIIQQYLSTCTYYNGTCYVPITFQSAHKGTLYLTSIYFTNSGYIINDIQGNISDFVTQTQTFYINLTYDNILYDNIDAQLQSNLIQNVSPFPSVQMNRTLNGNLAYFTKTIDLPNQSGIDNAYNFWYNINLYNTASNSVDTSFEGIYNANILDWNFGVCNATNSGLLINITAKDEINQSFINPFSIQGALSYYLGSGTTYRQLIINNNSVNSLSLCTNIHNVNITGQLQIQSNGYNQNNYYFSNYPLLYNFPQNLSIYLLNSTVSTTFIFQVQDYQYLPLSNYYVYVYRYIPNSFTPELVQVLQTNADGQTIGNLEIQTVDYMFVITDSNGNIVKTTSKSKVIPESTPYTITFTLDNPNKNPLTYYSNLSNLNYQLTYNKNNYLVTYLYSDSDSSFVSSTLTVLSLNSSGSNSVICNISSTDANGVLTCNMSGNLSGSYVAQAFDTRGTKTILVDQLPFTIEGMSQVIGRLGVLAAFFILLICAFLFAYNEIAGIISVNIGIIFIQLMGLMNIGYLAIGGIIAVSIILLIVLES